MEELIKRLKELQSKETDALVKIGIGRAIMEVYQLEIDILNRPKV